MIKLPLLFRRRVITKLRRTDSEKIGELIRKLRPLLSGIDLVRLGSNSDGGYVLPDDLNGIAACFSPGVGNMSGFEKDCADRGMSVFLADGTVDSPAMTNDKFHFIKKNIGAVNTDNCITLDKWVADSLSQEGADLLLQMDIEGSEYETFLSISESLMKRFRIMVVEFHWLHLLCSRPFFALVAPVFDKILQTHDCIHIHPNNYDMPKRKFSLDIPPTMEFTFLRKDRMRGSGGYASVFPHKLDSDNGKDRPALLLPPCWQGE